MSLQHKKTWLDHSGDRSGWFFWDDFQPFSSINSHQGQLWLRVPHCGVLMKCWPSAIRFDTTSIPLRIFWTGTSRVSAPLKGSGGGGIVELLSVAEQVETQVDICWNEHSRVCTILTWLYGITKVEYVQPRHFGRLQLVEDRQDSPIVSGSNSVVNGWRCGFLFTKALVKELTSERMSMETPSRRRTANPTGGSGDKNSEHVDTSLIFRWFLHHSAIKELRFRHM